jgi:hypothetical protein
VLVTDMGNHKIRICVTKETQRPTHHGWRFPYGVKLCRSAPNRGAVEPNLSTTMEAGHIVSAS